MGGEGHYPIAQNLIDTRIGESLVVGESSSKERHGFGYRLQTPLRNIFFQLNIEVSLQERRHSVPNEVTEIKTQRGGPVALIFRVLAPVAGDDVQPSITIQITRRDSIPPAGQ